MPSRAVHANLALHFRNDANETVLDVRVQEPPLRVVRGFRAADGSLLAHLHNLSGGVLGGDQLGLSIHVGAGARAQVTSTGSTRLYRQRQGEADTTQHTLIRVETGGLLEYLPDTLIPYAGSRYRQRTQVELAPDAGLFYWEIVTPGREAKGERFAYELLRLDLDICGDGRPIASERVQIEPALRLPSSLVRLGCYGYFATFYICRVGVAANRWLELEAYLDETARSLTDLDQALWGVSTLTAHGLVVRVLSINSRAIMSGFLSLWQIAKKELYQAEAVLPRKIN